jgi:general secretion pathway protein B
MSFILDALKKAEREPSRVPTLATVHGPAREKKIRAVGPWGVASVLMAGGGLLTWLLWPPPNAVSPPASDFQARMSAPSPASRTNAERKTAPAAPGDGPSSAPMARVPPPPDPGQERGGPRQMTNPPQMPPRSVQAPSTDFPLLGGVPSGAGAAASSQRQRVETRPIEPRGAEAPFIAGRPMTPKPAEPSVPSQAEPSVDADRAGAEVVSPSAPSLPAKTPTLREAIAKMTLDVFVYTAAKADRMVVINGRRYVQGQYVDGLYLLEDISPEGVILSYQGERALLRP